MVQHLSIEAPILFDVARDAYERSSLVPPENKHDFAALTAIAFSAFSLEAFINEAGLLASLAQTNPPSVAAFGTMLEEVEESRGSTEIKFMLARFAFTGTPYNAGQRPFQDFSLLMKVRNALVHLKPRLETVGRVQRKIDPSIWADFEKLRAELEREPLFKEAQPKASIIDQLPNKILRDVKKGVRVNWTVRVSTKVAAGWACNTAADMVQDFIKLVPDSPLKIGLRVFYESTFRRVS